MSLILVAAYDAKISRAEQEKKRLREDAEQRNREISQLEEQGECIDLVQAVTAHHTVLLQAFKT